MRVTLNGYAVADDDLWVYKFFKMAAFSPDMVRQAILLNPKGEELVFEVNSPGGSVLAGHEMYSVLRSAHGRIRTSAEVQSLAASAASVMMLGCDRIALSPVAQVMIHLPMVCTEGGVAAHQASIRMLESTRTAILNAYELRCSGKSNREQLEAMVDQESWFPAQEAVAAGLADSILYQDGEEPLTIPSAMTNAVGGGIRALANSAGAAPTPAELRARYQQLVDAGKAPPSPDGCTPNDPVTPAGEASAVSDDWRRKARLTIEKNRFL